MDCLFCRIIAGEIPSKKLYEDDDVLAFYDIDPQAPVHFLVIPKAHISGPDAVNEENCAVVGKIYAVIAKLSGRFQLRRGRRPDRRPHPLPCSCRPQSCVASRLIDALSSTHSPFS